MTRIADGSRVMWESVSRKARIYVGKAIRLSNGYATCIANHYVSGRGLAATVKPLGYRIEERVKLTSLKAI